MKKCVKIAHHISGFWRPHITSDTLTTGSLGAGLLISPYLESCIVDSEKFSITINGKKTSIRPVEELVRNNREKISEHGISVREPLPLGKGYATSASITMSIALLSLGKLTFLDRMDKAHESEVNSLTGLGDVSSIVHGHDLAIRLVPGSPSVARVNSMPVDNSIKITSVVLGNYTTTVMLKEKMNLFVKHGEETWREFLENPSLESFVDLARRFSYNTGMMKGVDRIVYNIKHLGSDALIGFFVKKAILVIVHDSRYEDDIRSILLKDFNENQVFTHNIVWNGIIY